MKQLRRDLGRGVCVGVAVLCLTAALSVPDAQADEPQPAAGAKAAAEHYGDLVGQYVFDGTPPKLAPLVAAGAVRAGAPLGPVPNEKLIVDPKTKGIANILVYLVKVPTVHPSLATSAKPEVVLDEVGFCFVPHVLFLRTDQSLRVKSADPAAHQPHSLPLRNIPFSVALPARDRVGKAFTCKIPENLPFRIKCDFCPWMDAYCLVLDHPYAAVTDADGTFKIEKLPVGLHKFKVWHESAGYIDRALAVEIKSDETTDLGVLKVPETKLGIRP